MPINMKNIIFMALVVYTSALPKDTSEALQPLQLSEFINNAQKNINNLAANIKNQLNIPDQDTVVNTLKNQSSTFVNNVQQYITSVSEEVKSKTPELEKLWADVKNKLSKVIEDINANVPNAKESAEKLQKQFQEGVETLVKESNTIAEAFKQNSGHVKEEIAGFTKKAVDIAVEATQNLNDQLKSAANQATIAIDKKN
ncbi:PREDICTED: uncharacterized protein LOC105363678 [Ceratosolen solmsi marchali]|uniref:Uncharacterized protein LOC105363678 n=1 Tax=Ceratosolen solmsi marchali TaxID=326594 RepID=A0AAJ6YKH8_9HYME|nr:PREDICTED: uncharacterized protein LOC105363678 [Ceratosolen solmsi marchali]